MSDPGYIIDLLQGRTPTDPEPSDPPWSDLANYLRKIEVDGRAAALEQWLASDCTGRETVLESLFEHRPSSADSDGTANTGRIWTVDNLIDTHFDDVPVLVGDISNAIFVRKEGHFIVGPSGIGKTLLVIDMSLRLSSQSQREVFGYRFSGPFKVLIYQAELPMQFIQYRFSRIIDDFEQNGSDDIRDGLSRIFLKEMTMSLDLRVSSNRQILKDEVEQVGADVVFIDPFLSFFHSEENANFEIRKFLDDLKFDIAEACNCGIILTDHISKSDPGKGARMRGAGAKADWAALVINLSPHMSQADSNYRSIKVEFTKVRYGQMPSEPIILMRQVDSLRFSPCDPEQDPIMNEIRRIVCGAGGRVETQGEMLSIMREQFNIGSRTARRYLDSAVQQGILARTTGANNSFVYHLPDNSVVEEGDDEQ